MNKTAIKNFAIWARNKLRADIILKAGLLGITDKEIANPLPQSTDDLQLFDIGTSQPVHLEGKAAIDQRQSLVAAIRAKKLKHAEAFDAVIEEVAYTWFNRLIAVRFMEVNDYLPSRVRVLSSENPAKAEPDFVTNPFDTDLDFSEDEFNLVDNLKDNNKSDKLFQFLFIKQCNKLNEILPELFEETNDYTELLLNVSFTDKDGVVYHLVHDISEDDFNIEKQGQVEIIGWLYQYYNTEPKDKVFGRPSGQKIRKEDVPAATQLFTPDWIVRYMVENSLGRIAIHNLKYGDWDDTERAKIDTFKSKWKYYLEEAEQSQEIIDRFRMEESNKYNKDDVPPYVDSTFLDPCMGSGHILVYAFDVFMDIYTAQGYTERDAAQRIVEKNLYGLELDDRATQLAYFAVMMKARSYDRRFLTRGIRPNLCSIQESNSLNTDYLELFGDLKPTAQKLVDEFIDAKEYGSILNLKVTKDEITQLENKFNEIKNAEYDNLYDSANQNILITTLAPLIRQAKIMVQKYEVVCTNPPYMGGSGMSAKLNAFVKKYYPDSKADLFSVFIEKGNNWVVRDGYNSMVTMQSWMFLTSFESMRDSILSTKTITNLMHMENMVMGIAFGTAVTVFKNCRIPQYKGTYNHITVKDIDKDSPKVFPNYNNRFAQTSTDNFSKIPSKPIAYWISDDFLKIFNNPLVGDLADSKQGIATADNNRFLRLWFECNLNDLYLNCESHEQSISSTKKWYPYNKGGEFRRWFGNNDYVVNWKYDGRELRQFKKSVIRNPSYYFKECFSWSLVTSGITAFRYKPVGHIFDVAGMSCFSDNNLLYLLGLCNSVVVTEVLKVIAPTINYQCGDIAHIPVIIDAERKTDIETLVSKNIDYAKIDWDSYEVSWDFEEHPFIRWSKELRDCTSIAATMEYFYSDQPKVSCPLELCFMLWQGECRKRFEELKENEETLNRYFIDIYGLQNELQSDLLDKYVTIRKAKLDRDMRSFVSYAVGCMFGRYSLDTEGLAYAGGEWDSDKYKSFIPDEDNCIPITDTAYFEDDIVGRFCEFVKVVYGEDTLEANLEYIAKALGSTLR